jgi:hypothetical protein
MSNIFQDYQAQKVKEVMLYILNKAGDTGYFRLMKTMFCADRQNLLKWGDQITELDYFARKHGPVPTSVHDGLLSVYQGTESEFSDILTVCGNFMMVHPLREPNLDYLSETDKESIDKAIDEYFSAKYEWYRKYYMPLQLMNFLRILQYGHEEKVITYLKQVIEGQLSIINNPKNA